VKLGAWDHTGSFADQRFNAQGPLAASSANPLQHADNFTVYGVIDQMLWRPDGRGSDRGLNFFLRASAAPSEADPAASAEFGAFIFRCRARQDGLAARSSRRIISDEGG
jgi:Carbohydrate-selective porin, OprB family